MKRGVYDRPIKERRAIARSMNEESKLYGADFIDLDKVQMLPLADRNGTPVLLIKAWRNHRFIVQVYDQGNWIRLSVNRTKYDPEQNVWVEGITWDELMECKRGVGFGASDAIEVYPADEDVVNVSNMRHLFIAKNGEAPDCIWRKR